MYNPTLYVLNYTCPILDTSCTLILASETFIIVAQGAFLFTTIASAFLKPHANNLPTLITYNYHNSWLFLENTCL